MEFKKERVFTALNADELKVGSRVYVADDIESLRIRVYRELNIATVSDITDESNEHRIVVRFDDGGIEYAWALAYYVAPPEEKKLKWTDLKIGDVVTNGNRVYMVTGIDKSGKWGSHVQFGQEWICDEDLKDWEKVVNGFYD